VGVSALPIDVPVDGAGEFTRYLEGYGVNTYPEPPEHSHRCPDCFEDWTHRDEACAFEALPDPWARVQTGGYAACPDCAAPGSNGSLRRWCSRCQAFVLADPAGFPGCGCAWRFTILPFGRSVGFVQDATQGWEGRL